MAIEYLGLSEINGPLIALEGVKDAAFDEIVEFSINDGAEKRLGRIIEIYEDKAIIQVFEGSEGMSLTNTHTKLTGHPMEVALSPEILGRTFNGIGKPIDGLAPIVGEKRDVNGKPLNPVSREYPRNYIRTGISVVRNYLSSPEMDFHTTNWLLNWLTSLLLEMTQTKNLLLFLRQWVLKMTLLISSNDHLKNQVLWNIR